MVERDVCAIEALARSKGASCWAVLPLLGRRLWGVAATRRALGILYRALLHTRKGAVVSRYPYLLFFYSDTL